MAVNYDGIPQAMKKCPHWILWKYEERDGKRTKVPIQPNGRNASTTNPKTWSDFAKVTKVYDMHVGDGLGFVFTRDTFSGVDLDHCRDKSTGEIDVWANAYISKFISYTEVSPSGEGVHVIVKGAIREGCTGRKKELKDPEGTTVFERLYGRKAAIEIYSERRFFTVTGDRLQECPETVEEREEVLHEVYDDVFLVDIIDESEPTEPVNASLSDDHIIELASSAANSDKFKRLMQGDKTGYPSESEADGALSCILVFYTRDYPQILRIIHQSKLWDEKWEREDYQKATINSALSKVTETYKGSAMNVRPVSLDNESGYIGLDIDGALKIVTYKDSVSKLDWFSDCPVSVSTETSANGKTEFTFTGIGAKDKRHVSFTLSADDVNELSRFKAAMTNAFGAPNKLGKMSWETAQKITLHTSRKTRIERPTWDENKPVLPGIDAPGVEYRLSPKIPAEVYDGDLCEATELLRKAMKINRWTPLLIATILGAPVFAKWFKKDRFGLGIWGLTNSLKTSTVCALMTMYGTGYGDGPKLKSGQVGGTAYGVSLVFAAAGWLPQPYDNVKTVDPHDAVSYIGNMNAVLEGDGKVQGTKDGTIRPTLDYACTPLVTGEVRPQDAATTSRVPAINWSGVNTDILRVVQLGVATMPTIGYKWLMHLATVEDIDKEQFYKYQAQKLAELIKAGHTVAGRTATIYAMLALVWNMLEVSPFGAVFEENKDTFKKSLDEMAATQGETTGNETESARFMAGLNELMMGNPGLFMDIHCSKRIVGAAIGKMMPEGVWLLPIETLNELSKIKVFTQIPTVSSMTDALDRADLLIHTPDRKRKYVVKMNGAAVRGWYVKLVTPEGEELVTPNEEDGYTQGVTEKPYQESTGYTVTPVSPQQDEVVKPVQNTTSPSKQKPNHDKKGVTGVTGVTREEKKIDNIVTDIDINKDDTVTPSVTPSYTLDKKKEAEKARLWDSISLKLKKHSRKDGLRCGLASSDLAPEELELVKSSGWSVETTDQGITILWAPEKAARAMGQEGKA